MKGELGGITRHAVTVLAGQLAVMAFGVTDTIVAARYSDDAVAALSVGSAVFVSVYVSLMGIFQALLPLWAEQRGARQPEAIGASLRQSMYLCAGACVLGMWALLSPDILLRATNVPAELQKEVKLYLGVLSLGLLPALLFRIYSTLNQALGHPKLVTWLQVFSLALKVPLSIWFTFGGAGVPAMGVEGCAWATVLVNYAMLAIALVLLRRQSLYAPLRIWQAMPAPDWAQLLRFVRIGVPAGLAILVEITSFTLMALYIAKQGNLSSASHQIASNLAAVCYMIPLSLAIATSARVSYWRGAGNELLARQLIAQGFKLTALMGCVTAAILFFTRSHIVQTYTDSAPVITLTTALLAWVALYHVADAVQTFCIFVLRSYRITVAPLIIYGVLLWGGGLGVGHWLAYDAPASMHFDFIPARTPMPFWFTSACALLITAVVFSALLRWVVRRPIDNTTTPAA